MTPFYQDDFVTIYHGDCRDIIGSLPKFDLLLTDPPYGLGDRLSIGGTWAKNSIYREMPKWDSETVDVDTINSCISLATRSIIWGG